MIFSAEVSSKSVPLKTDNSSKKKSRIPGSGQKKTRPEPSCSKQTPDTVPFKTQDKTLEDHQLRLKLLELTPKNPGKKTSEGVQNFINHVSSYIEQKNPFKDKNSEGRVKKNTDKASEILAKAKTCKPDNLSCKELNNLTKNCDGKAKGEPKSPTPLFKKSDIKNKLVNETSDKKTGKEILKPPLENHEIKPKQNSLTQPNKSLDRDVSCKETPKPDVQHLEYSPVPRTLQGKKIRPSEIPLRKDRADLKKRIQPVSCLLQKPLKEIESVVSMNFYEKKTFSPIEELSVCSDLHITEPVVDNINSVISKDAFENRPSTAEIVATTSVDDSENIQLNRCSKNLNIHLDSDYCTYELNEKSPRTRSRMLDLEKMRSSSVTVLTSNSGTLSKLESYHQQNLSAKEPGRAVNNNSSRLKILSSKTSFNSLKGRGSKKNLSTRLSSKGNKPVLKSKTKKPQKNSLEQIQVKKTPESSFVDLYEQFLRTGGVDYSDLLDYSSDGETKETKALRKSNFSVVKSSCRLSDTGGLDTKSDPNLLNSELAQGEGESLLKTLESMVNELEKQICCERKSTTPPPPPPTPEDETKVVEEKQLIGEIFDKSLRMLELTEKRHQETQLVSVEHKKKKEKNSKQIYAKKEKIDCSMLNIKIEDLILKGTALTFLNDSKGSENMEKEKVKLEININVDAEGMLEENFNPVETKTSFDRLYLPHTNENIYEKDSCDGMENLKILAEKKAIENQKADLEEQVKMEELDTTLKKVFRSSTSLKTDIKAAFNTKSVTRKQMRSDAGDRWLSTSTESLNAAITFQTKAKPDAKFRSGLTKSSTRESKHSTKDIFEDVAAAKLKRRNSEPNSFRGFVWKRTDLAVPRGNNASVSSMASSLRHLNTDELEDFIFWEALPQKMTSCWEMSLYHFKRPWSVLSCSIFKDNRESNTPGMILQTLRNGGGSTERQVQQTDNGRILSKENSFDVEPSIAQKNIDIRNWLAALNFPTLPSTSADAISEGNFFNQSLACIQNINKNQINHKHRKILSGLQCPNEIVERKSEEKKRSNDSGSKWGPNEMENLMELIRRNSGGFVTSEQHFNSEISTSSSPVIVNYCNYSNSDEEENVFEEAETELVSNNNEESFEVQNATSVNSEVAEWHDVQQSESEQILKLEDKPTAESQQHSLLKSSSTGQEAISSGVNIWKYLFMVTLTTFMIYLYWIEKKC